MVVKCIESTWCKDSSAISVTKGNIYNVTAVIDKLGNRSVFREGTTNSIWYEFLETGTWVHHSSCFEEINPEEYFEIENKNIEKLTI